MTRLARVRSFLMALFRRGRIERDMAEEWQFHLDTRTDALVAAGMTRADAVRQARIEFGDTLRWREQGREALGLQLLQDLSADMRYALRQMRRAPGLTAIAILSLALGIGANTAIFSLINTLMLRLLPVRAPEQLVELLSQYPGEPRMNYFAWPVYERFRDQNHVFSDLVGAAPTSLQVSGDGFGPTAMDGAYVVGNFFPALGLKPAIGRLIGPQDDPSSASADHDAGVAVVSWSYWKTRLNSDPGIPGARISVNGVQTTVIGVTPPAFFGLQVGSRIDVWMPVAMELTTLPANQRANGLLGLQLMARLKPGISADHALADMRVLDRSRVEEMAIAMRDPVWRQARIDLEPAGAGFSALRDEYGNALLVLMAVVGLLLLLACANVASMLLARAAARQREMAVRIALGAGRRRLARQVLTESLLLSSIGAVVGIALAYWGTAVLVQTIESQPPRFMSLHIQVEPDVHVLLFAIGAALLTGLLFGLAPALYASQSAPAAALIDSGRASETRSRRAFGKSLTVVQVAVSVVLVSAAGLFARHLSSLRNDDVGSARDAVLLVTANPQGSGLDRNQLSRLYEDLLPRLEAIPRVRSATLSGPTLIPGAGGSIFIAVERVRETTPSSRIAVNAVAPKYFTTFGIPFVSGRDFSVEDEGRSRVAIVNVAMARHYFGDDNPIGKHFTVEGVDQPCEIVGVVADTKYANVHNAAPRQIYFNVFQGGNIQSQFALRTEGSPTVVAGDVRRTFSEALKTVLVANEMTLADRIDASIVPERLIAMLSEFFGGLGALLAAIGLYGLLAYTVARRTNEIGIRMALGATRRDVTAMVLKSALGLMSAGVAIGVPVALWSKHFAASAVANIDVDSAVPLGVAVVAMVGVALLAAYVPARRAARVDPIVALRHE
jgi:predicted permease